MADELNNSDNSPMTILKMPLLCAVATLVIAMLMIAMYLVPAVGSFNETNQNFKTVSDEYNNNMKTLEELKASAELAESESASEPGSDKPFFKPLESGSDPDVVIAGEFNEILALITANQIKTRSVKYDYEPKGDPFFEHASGKYSVCKLDMEMIANYTNFKNFLKDLYKHEHYLDISKIEIVPYSKDKSVLLITFQLKLYAEKA